MTNTMTKTNGAVSFVSAACMAAIATATLLSSAAFSSAAEGELSGKWRDNTCSYAENFGKSYRQRTYLFDAEKDRAVLLSKFYFDKDCTELRFSYRISAVFEQEVTNEEKAKGDFGLKYAKQTFKVRSAKAAKQFNKDKVCGITTWKAKDYVAVDGKECFGLSIPKKDTKLEGTYNINRAGDRVKVVFKDINGKDHVVKLDKDGKEDEDDS